MQEFLLALPVLLFSMVAHEYAHGYAALKQGDDTALMMGRLTFNPLKHIDPWMSIALPAMLWFASGGAMIFGGAKPVPVNPRKFRRYRRGDIIVSSAGVITNLGLTLVFLAATVGVGMLAGGDGRTASQGLVLLQRMAMLGVWINLLLAFFNLIPVPPLDGSHLLYHALPPAAGARYRALSPYGLVLLPLMILFTPGLFRLLLSPAIMLNRAAMTLAAPWALQPGLGY